MFLALCTAVALVSALGTIANRNPLRSAVSLLIHILALAGLYLRLNAHLLAAVQLIVYAGAVVVLFIFVIMLIGPTARAKGETRGVITRTIGGSLLALVFAALAFGLGQSTLNQPDGSPPAIVCVQENSADCELFGGVRALAHEIYVDSLVPFELASILLLVAIIGAIAVARGRQEKNTPQTEIQQGVAATQPPSVNA